MAVVTAVPEQGQEEAHYIPKLTSSYPTSTTHLSQIQKQRDGGKLTAMLVIGNQVIKQTH